MFKSRHALERWLAREVLGKEIGRKPPQSERRETPERDWKYRAWIRSLPCAACGSERFVEAAHTGPHGFSQKSADTTCIPLCAPHHRTRSDAYHFLGEKSFERRHKLKIRALVKRLNRTWRMMQRSAA